MKITKEYLLEKIKAIKNAEGYSRIAMFTLPVGTKFSSTGYYGNSVCDYALDTEYTVRLSDIDAERGICGYGYRRATRIVKEESYYNNTSSYGYIAISWDELLKNKQIVKSFIEWLDKVTPDFSVTKDKGVIKFVNNKTKEELFCDLGKQTFIRTYKKGKPKQIRYPMQFFKYVSGRLLINKITDGDCKNFHTLVNLVGKHYKLCRNFGTFLVRMFDHIHLETYIAANVNFEFDIPFAYSDFDKDIRNKLNEHGLTYNTDVGSLFCSDKDTGRAVFAQIRDTDGFANMVKILALNIQPLNTLVNHYNYDLKTLFAYCRERKWKSNRLRYGYGYSTDNDRPDPETTSDSLTTYGYDIISYLRDYSRMALDVYGENYDKYPKNLKEAHDETSALHTVRAMQIDAKRFEETIDKSLEWSNKEFAIVYPKTADEVVTEGVKLRHCVGSYIQSVVNGECKIIFLRKKEELDKPFVTIEISGGNIRQARAFANSNPPYDAKMALQDYAKAKKFLYTG